MKYRSKYSCSFDGIRQYCDLGAVPGIIGQSKISVMGWIKPPTDGVKGLGHIFGLGGWWDEAPLMLGMSSDSRVPGAKFWWKTDYGKGSRLLSGPTYALDEWHHVIGILDGDQPVSSDRLRLYVDGVEITSTFGASPTVGHNAPPGSYEARIAANVGVGTNWPSLAAIRAQISEIAIWKGKALTKAEAKVVYGNKKGTDLAKKGLLPNHWLWMGDGDTYPVIEDHGSEPFPGMLVDMIPSDVVKDAP